MLVNSYNISKTLNAYNSKCHLWTYALLALRSSIVTYMRCLFLLERESRDEKSTQGNLGTYFEFAIFSIWTQINKKKTYLYNLRGHFLFFYFHFQLFCRHGSSAFLRLFTLIFCLCNSFQGLVLFLLFCARQEDVRKTLRPYMRRLCCKFSIPSSRLQTASTGLSSTSRSKSPYSDMDFSASAKLSKSPYSEMDFSAAVPMSPLSEDNSTYDTTEDAMEQTAAPVVIKEEELSHNTKETPAASDSVAIVQAGSGSENTECVRSRSRWWSSFFVWKCQTSSREKRWGATY